MEKLNKQRGLRNCNPLNIRRTADLWQGLAERQPDPEFFTFRSMPWGYRAAFIVGRGLLWGNLAAGLLCWLQARFHLLRLDPAGYMLSEVPVAVSAGWWLAVDVAAAGAILALLLVPAAFVARIRPDEAIKTD